MSQKIKLAHARLPLMKELRHILELMYRVELLRLIKDLDSPKHFQKPLVSFQAIELTNFIRKWTDRPMNFILRQEREEFWRLRRWKDQLRPPLLIKKLEFWGTIKWARKLETKLSKWCTLVNSTMILTSHEKPTHLTWIRLLLRTRSESNS